MTITRPRKHTEKKRTNGPLYQLLPDLPPEEFASLKADIAENGLQYPVIQDEHGDTLDGHQRERALAELGIKNFPVKVIAGMTDEEKRHYALALNVKRRHLSGAQKRQLIAQEPKRTPDLANSWLADLVGVDTKTVQAVRGHLEATLEIPKLAKLRGKDGRRRSARYSQIIANTPRELDVARSVIADLPDEDGRILDTITAQRRSRRNVRRQIRKGKLIRPSPPDDIRLYHCRFQDLEPIAGLRPRSVSLVLTDIPYGRPFLPEVDDLGRLAGRILRDRGLFVTYCGQYYLPQILRTLGRHLTYRWQMASMWSGDSNLIHPLQITSQWKPILVFSKDAWQERKRWNDTSTVRAKDKYWHEWQQDLQEVEMLVNYFSGPGDLICDPCGGSFTSAVAARRTGRRFVGCDVVRDCVSIGYERLEHGR